jgi:alkyldihydroxyacetonephosphate synthase
MPAAPSTVRQCGIEASDEEQLMTTAPAAAPRDPSERSWWGWGWTEQALSDDECRSLGQVLPGLASDPLPVPPADGLRLAAPRIAPPQALAAVFSGEPRDRASHTYGKAFRDIVRALRMDYGHAPDLVVRPRDERDIVDVLDWAAAADVAVVPYGGGSSVVGGVEYRSAAHRAVVSLDLAAMRQVLDIDHGGHAALIQGGAFGPDLEHQLAGHGLTLRFFPQSFEFSTLGGWLATRAGGHFATGDTHIDDLTEAIRVVTPHGVSESWRLPASGAGPSHDRLFLGSEGALGIITQAWMRVRPRPVHRAAASVRFADVHQGFAAVRAITQSGLRPANCRLLDPTEAVLSGVGNGRESILVLGVESATAPVGGRLAELVELAADAGGTASSAAGGGQAPRDGDDRGAATWRAAFLRMPYIRDGIARMGGIAETFETAITWDRLAGLYESVRDELHAAIKDVCGVDGVIACRLTHAYPDGAAPYFTVTAPAGGTDQLRSWDALKAVAGDVLARHGATITHHHAVGRDHRPWYDRQRPEPFGAALRAVKRELDPAGILNPGILVGT